MLPAKSTYTFKSIDNCDIRADVYRAPGARRPAILWLHGGALIVGSRAMLPVAQLERYLRAGYTIVAADYRLAPETKLRDIITDVQEAYAWMRADGAEELGLDPDRIAVLGHSAGAYLTLVAGYALSPRPRVLVSYYGYSDIDGDWYSRPDSFYCQLPRVPTMEAYEVIGRQAISESPVNERGRFYLYCRQQGLWAKEVAGYNPRLEPRVFDRLCPIRNVSADYPPTLLIHGEADTDVPHEQSGRMARELERQAVTHEFVSLPNYGHAFDIEGEGMHDPITARTFDRALAFLDQHMSNA
jgi:acetyl esterase/lipase